MIDRSEFKIAFNADSYVKRPGGAPTHMYDAMLAHGDAIFHPNGDLYICVGACWPTGAGRLVYILESGSGELLNKTAPQLEGWRIREGA
jgi:hypothetical protein